MYKDLRYVQSIVIALATVGFICFFGVRVLSLKKELRGTFAAHYLPYCFALCFFTVFEFHVSKVVASAAWHYKQTKEIPESFQTKIKATIEEVEVSQPVPVRSIDESSPYKQSTISQKPMLHFEDNARNFSVDGGSVKSGL
jgi:hypothetical protein